jgi:hypothetical protein
MIMKILRIAMQRVCAPFIGKISATVALCAAMTTVFASGPDDLAGARANYQAERAICLDGHSNQDRATCLKEAGAAFDEARHGRLSDRNTEYQKNAMIRCAKLDSDTRDACERRMHGEGVVTGSVAAGGLYRELTIPIPAQ